MGVREVTSLDKSVIFWTQHGFGYGYGGKFGDPKSPSLDKVILKVSGNFESSDKRKAHGIVAIHVDDLLISGVMFYRLYSQENEGGIRGG